MIAQLLPHRPPKATRRGSATRSRFHRWRRTLLVGLVLTVAAFGGAGAGYLAQPTAAAPAEQPDAEAPIDALRVHGLPVVSNPNHPAHANRPASAGDDSIVDPLTGLLPEDAPYTTLDGPFDPYSDQAPEMDLVTWNPAWISERLGDRNLRAQWPSLSGIDEVSRAANIRASGVNASEKVWLRHWYEPTHLALDLNADGRLTDADNDGIPDAALNPATSNTDEWYPAIMTELTWMLVDNERLPQADPAGRDLYRSAPRPTCGLPGNTRMVFPVGTGLDATDPDGPAVGHGLTSLDADFDGRLDMVHVADEASLPQALDGLQLDFDGDGLLDPLDPDGSPLSCDELVVLHTEAKFLRQGDRLQFLDHFVTLDAVSTSGATLEVWNSYGLTPRPIQSSSLGIGGAVLAGDTGSLLRIAPGGDNLGRVPPGAWFAYLVDADPDADTALVIVGRALGAPCASMQSAPRQANRSAGGPWFLKRLYVDGHQYDLTAISTCPSGGLESITLRAPIPKVDVTIEQHSVRLQGYALAEDEPLPWLPLPPPFNHEHTRLMDVHDLAGLDDLDPAPEGEIERPTLLYTGGPAGPMPPILESPDLLPYSGRLASGAAATHGQLRASRWTYVAETTDADLVGLIRERLGMPPEDVLGEPPTPRPPAVFPSRTPRPTATPSPTFTPSPTPSATSTPSNTPTASPTNPPSVTPTNTPTATATATPLPLMDLGDAPASLGYPVLLAQNGARHRLPVEEASGGASADTAQDPIQLGACIDAEHDAAPNLAADGDDIDGDCDDEDGLMVISALRPGLIATMRLDLRQAPPGGFLSAWIDFNRDGDWNDNGEQVLRDVLADGGIQLEDFLVPVDALAGPSYLRIRLSSMARLAPTGEARDGEVEDYRVEILPIICPDASLDEFSITTNPVIRNTMVVDASEPGPRTVIDDGNGDVLGRWRQITLGPFTGGNFGAPLNQVAVRISSNRVEYAANPDSQADFELVYDAGGAGLELDIRGLDRIRFYFVFADSGVSDFTPITVELFDGANTASLQSIFMPNTTPFFVDFPLADFEGIDQIDEQDVFSITIRLDTSPAEDFSLDAIRFCPPEEDAAASPLGDLAEASRGLEIPMAPDQGGGNDGFFYNEQVMSLPRHYTEFLMPDLPEPAGQQVDRYHVASAFEDPYARWRRWQMPDGPLADDIPPAPADLAVDIDSPPGLTRRATFWHEPDGSFQPSPALWVDAAGARLHGGQPVTPGQIECDPGRPALLASAGDMDIFSDRLDPTRPVEIFPYTDPWAPFSSQHPDAPRADIVSVSPAYMDEFRHFGEPLAALYRQISTDGQNARQKVYHRLWYEPEHLSVIPVLDDCRRDLQFPALLQEYTFLLMDTFDRPGSTGAGAGNLAFPLAGRPADLPLPLPGGALPAGGEIGAGLTTFDANFDGQPEAVTLHSERSLNERLDTLWQSHRPMPAPPLAGPTLDFDGDGLIEDLDVDGTVMTGDEMLVLTLEDLVLDLDPASAIRESAMMLDYLVQVEGVTRGQRAQVQIWFTGGLRPVKVGGPLSLQIGDALLVDRYQDRVTVVRPGEINPGTDGAWMLFLTDVERDADQLTLVLGRALGATHSALADGVGGQDLLPGDPWYLKRFQVDGQAYDLVALMTPPGNRFSFLTLRTALPIGPLFDPRDSLARQGYLDGGPEMASVLPPFNGRYTRAIDYERIPAEDFAHTRRYADCVGPIEPYGPLTETLSNMGVESRYTAGLREIRCGGPLLGITGTSDAEGQLEAALGADVGGAYRRAGGPAPSLLPMLRPSSDTVRDVTATTDDDAPLAPDAPAALDQGSFPANADWVFLANDLDESGCAAQRDLSATYFASDAGYLYLRMVTQNGAPAGWPGTNGATSEARYKWWVDTAGGNTSVFGTSVANAEYLLMVEDRTDNADDPTTDRDQLGEQTLMDDPTNIGFTSRWSNGLAYGTGVPNAGPAGTDWVRELGAGTAGTGGPQSVLGADIGYRIQGDTLDMYVSWDQLGLNGPTNVCVLWATDISNTNLDQAPNCDRPTVTTCIQIPVVPTPTPTSTATATSSPTATSTATATSSPTATNTPTNTPTTAPSATATNTATATSTPTQTATPDPGQPTATPTATATLAPPTATLAPADLSCSAWQTDQAWTVPDEMITVSLSGGQTYLYTSVWRSSVSRIHLHGCLLPEGVAPPGAVELDHALISQFAAAWGIDPSFLPPPNEFDPPQPDEAILDGGPPFYASYFDAALGGPSQRVKRFFDPADPPRDIYVNRLDWPDEPEAGGSGDEALPPPLLLLEASLLDESPNVVELRWREPAASEGHIELEASLDGAGYTPIRTAELGAQGSGSILPVGLESAAAEGSYRSPPLPAGLELRFRARRVNPRLDLVGDWTDPTAPLIVPQTVTGPGPFEGCATGTITQQGRDDHGGAWLSLDGFPLVRTDAAGNFERCGLPPLDLNLEASAMGYLDRLGDFAIPSGSSIALPPVELLGGDVDADGRVGLFDLVRVGASFQTESPRDRATDLNDDGRVDLFDLVMVSRQFGLQGPLPWGESLGDGPSNDAIDPLSEGLVSESDLPALPAYAPAALDDESQLELLLTVERAQALYGAELVLAFDPSRLRLLDADPEREGMQVEPGDLWPADGSIVARNLLDAEAGEDGLQRLRFAASRMLPAAPAWGRAELVRLRFEALEGAGSLDEAWSVEQLTLSDARGRSLPAEPLAPDRYRMIGRLFLPWLSQALR